MRSIRTWLHRKNMPRGYGNPCERAPSRCRAVATPTWRRFGRLPTPHARIAVFVSSRRRLLPHIPKDEPLMYVDHVNQHGEALFQRVCKLDLEGIVAKLKSGPYVSEREKSTWRKILNPSYSPRVGREELLERDRHREPVPGLAFLRVSVRRTESGS